MPDPPPIPAPPPPAPPGQRPTLAEITYRAGRAAWSIVGIVVVLYVLVWLLGRTRALLAPVVVSVALIYLLNPIVTRLANRSIPRIIGTFVAFVMLVGGITALGFLVVPSVSAQATELTENFPTIYEDSARQIEDLVDSTGFSVRLWTYEELESFVNDPDNQDQFFNAAFDRLGALTSGVLEAILVFFLAPVIAFYILIDLPRVRHEAEDLIPREQRDEVIHVFRQLGTAVGGFLRGQLLVALIVGVLTSFGFWLIGLDFWLIIGMIAGFLNIIPFVGPWVGGALGVMVGLVTGSVTTAAWAAVVAFAVQQIDNNFVSPTVLRATVRLHPAVVILVLILGGALGGLWGVLLAVPVTASVKIVAGHMWRTKVLGESWEEASGKLIADGSADARLPRRRKATGVIATAGVAGAADDDVPSTLPEADGAPTDVAATRPQETIPMEQGRTE